VISIWKYIDLKRGRKKERETVRNKQKHIYSKQERTTNEHIDLKRDRTIKEQNKRKTNGEKERKEKDRERKKENGEKIWEERTK